MEYLRLKHLCRLYNPHVSVKGPNRHPPKNYDETATSTETIQRLDQVIVINYLRLLV